MNLTDFHGIDWDDEEDEDGNLAHCLRVDHLGPNPERVVHEVLSEEPVEIKYPVRTADIAVVGPDRSRTVLWVVLLSVSSERSKVITSLEIEVTVRQAPFTAMLSPISAVDAAPDAPMPHKAPPGIFLSDATSPCSVIMPVNIYLTAITS